MGILRRRGTSTLEKLIFGFCILCCSRTILGAIYKAPCKVDLECHSLYNKNYHCEEYHCRRPKFDTSTKDIIGYIVIVLISSISNAGGMGAGSIIIPAYMAFYNFVATDAIPLSKLTIFAGASTNFILSWSQRDPKKQSRFLINYNMASYMVPMLLSGTQVGVLLAKFLPPALIWIGLLSYMLISIAKVFKR